MMRKIVYCIVLVVSTTGLSAQDFTRYVDPFIGTGGTSIETPGVISTYDKLKGQNKKIPFGGLTHPGAAVPFGMAQVGPDLNVGGFQWANGYNYYDSSVMGFSQMHTSGNGATFGVFLLMPTVGEPNLNAGTLDNPDAGYRSRFSKRSEKASPGYYRVFLQDYGIDAEMTATERVGFHKYTFPENTSSNIILDLKHGVSTDINGGWNTAEELGLEIVNDSLVTGYKKSEFATGPIFFAAQFSRPFQHYGVNVEGSDVRSREVKGKDIKAYFSYRTNQGEPIFIKIAVSVVSAAGALNNLKHELPDWDFEETKRSASKKWNAELSKIEVEGGTLEQKTIFYTALYHTMLAPFLFCDVDGKYLGSDGKIHDGKDFKNYTFFSLWDTYRALHPLLTILHPDRVNDMLCSMVVQAEYDSLHVFPNWSVAGLNYYGMVGHPGTSIVAEVYKKGFRNFDVSKAYRYMRNDAMNDSYGLQYYKSIGYIPSDKEDQATAKTLEYAYGDWCMAQLAKALGKRTDYQYFKARAGHYKNVFDKESGFMRGKLSDGSWKTPFDPREVSHYQKGEDFIEANAWQYTWSVQHDIPGLIELMGGKEKFSGKLDQLFNETSELTGSYSADVSGMVGQYAAGNEQCNHVAYLYDYIGQPWKAQKWLRHIMDTQYNATAAGIPGNDDAGQLSAWYVFSAMGFYPVNPVDGKYWIGTPIFNKMKINVGSEKYFVVEASNVSDKNFYVHSMRLNNTSLDRLYITHEQLMNGGIFQAEMKSYSKQN